MAQEALYWFGVLHVVLYALAGVGYVSGAFLNGIWGRIRDANSMLELQAALKMYRENTPPVERGEG